MLKILIIVYHTNNNLVTLDICKFSIINVLYKTDSIIT